MNSPITQPTRPTRRFTKMLAYSAALLTSLGILTATSSAHSGTDPSVLFAAPTPVSCQILVSEHRFGQTTEGFTSTAKNQSQTNKCTLLN